MLFVVLKKARVRVERQDALCFREARPLQEIPSVGYFTAKASCLAKIKAISRTCPGDQELVANVLASGLLLSDGTQVRFKSLVMMVLVDVSAIFFVKLLKTGVLCTGQLFIQ